MTKRSTAAFAVFALTVALSGCDGNQPATTGAAPAAVAPKKTTPSAAPAPAMPSAAAQTAAVAHFASGHRPIYCGGHAKPWVAFTFDDGPGPYTRHVLAMLRKANLPATFFVVGRNVAPNKSSLLAEKSARKPIGDHSWSHPLLTSLSAGEQRGQLLSTKSAIEGVTHQRVSLFRPPYGARNAATDKISRGAGMATILWNVDSQDALGADSKRISRRVRRGLHPGSIILMHENHGQTVRALKYTILPHLKKQNMIPVTVPEMLAGNPPTQAQLSRGRKGCR